MTWDELVELHAEATWTARQGGFMPWSDLSERGKEIEREVSRAALSAIREAGVRLMPEEATEEMLDVMHDRVRILVVPSERRADIQNDAEVYTAMCDVGEIKPAKEG